MNESNATLRPAVARRVLVALGIALVAQFVTSLVSGVLFLGPMVDTTDTADVVSRTAMEPARAYAGIGVDVVTALVIACLGILFACALRGVGEVTAYAAAGLYLVEAGLLLLSKVLGYGFVRGVEAKVPHHTLKVLLDSTMFAYALHMLAFCAGAFLFYWLLVHSSLLPAWMSWWGLVAMIPVALGTVGALVGLDLPFWLMLPYAPFELVAGVWLMWSAAKGNAPRPGGRGASQGVDDQPVGPPVPST